MTLDDAEIDQVVSEAGDFDIIIAGTLSAVQSQGQIKLIKRLVRLREKANCDSNEKSV